MSIILVFISIMNFRYQTPQLGNDDLSVIIARLDVFNSPIYIDAIPDPSAQVNECFTNVKAKVATDGGKEVLGWQVWISEHIIMAEFHAVWESTDERLFDITPKSPSRYQILFIQDDNMSYNGMQVDNLRINLTKNELVDQYILLQEAIHKVQNRGRLARLHGDEFIQALSEMDKSVIVAFSKMSNWMESKISIGGGVESFCFCNNKKAYKQCHGVFFYKMIDEMN